MIPAHVTARGIRPSPVMTARQVAHTVGAAQMALCSEPVNVSAPMWVDDLSINAQKKPV